MNKLSTKYFAAARLAGGCLLLGQLAWPSAAGAQTTSPAPARTTKPAPTVPASRPAVAPARTSAAQPTSVPAKAPAPTAKPVVTPAKPAPAAAKPGTAPTKSTTPLPAAKPATITPAVPKPAAPVPASKTLPGQAAPASATVAPAPKPAAPAGALPPLNSPDPAIRYRSGKALLDLGYNDLALKELSPLAQPGSRFARAADAAYLAAVAATRQRQWAEAEQLLNLLRHEYPTYPNLREALLLQGLLSFEQRDFDTALRTLAALPDSTLNTERENLKASYLPRLTDRATWQRLRTRYPQDATLARAYANLLLASGAEADRTVLNQLVTDFNLDRVRYAPRVLPRSVRKASYNVAVLLPFEVQDNSWQTQRKVQFVTDLYAGLRLAQDSLLRAGKSVQLYAYDTGADTTRLREVLALPELAGMDMLIGPIYKSGAKLLARYAQQHQIVCVNPLSQDDDLLQDNPWHYLFSPSAATQGRQAAQFAFTTFGGRPGVVLYEDGKDEADFAQAYQATYESLGGQILTSRRFNPDVDESLNAAFAGLDWTTAGHLVVASDNKRSGPHTYSALRAVPAAQRPQLIVPGAWLDNSRIEPSQLDQPGTYFVQPKYLNDKAPGYRRFRQLYLERQHLPPSVFASTGFELLMYFGQALHQYGTAPQTGLGAAPVTPGVLFTGVGYPAPAHDNQMVPFTRLDKLELLLLNPPTP